MARMPQRASAKEMLKILDNQWLSTNDIKTLACVGIRKAKQIKDEIAKQEADKNNFLPNSLVPSEAVIEYLNLNTKYLKKIVNQQIGGSKNDESCN